MEINKFNELWYSAFGWKLTKDNGIAEWSAFVEHPKSKDAALREVLGLYSKEFSQAKSEGKSNYRDRTPTLDEFKNRYFALLPELKRKWNAEQIGMRIDGRCLVCGGGGKVWTLAPQKDDGERRKCPEDWQTVGAENLYPFAEVRHCPVCAAGAYHDDHALRNRVQAVCLPEIVPAGDRRNPYGYALGGDALIRQYLGDKYGGGNAGNSRGNVPVARVVGFGHKLTQDEINAEEKRITDELAEKFGPGMSEVSA